MTFNTRRPVLPMLPMPPRKYVPIFPHRRMNLADESTRRSSSLDMPPFAFAPSSSGTSTPCYSEGLSLPHTPLPGTPLTLQFEKVSWFPLATRPWTLANMEIKGMADLVHDHADTDTQSTLYIRLSRRLSPTNGLDADALGNEQRTR